MLTRSDSDIVKYLKDFENQTKNLKLELMRSCWYMRGGLTWQEALHLPPEERQLISALVKENLETTKKSGQPFF